jgi:SAM-dependent methyltransferase
MPARMSFDRVAALYDETRTLAPRVVSRTVAVLADELQGKRVLEVGVGTGRFALPLQKSGVALVGVDISHKMIHRGLTKGLRDVLLADGARLPFPPKTFDMATTNHVLHLIADWREILLEIRRVTKEMYFTVIERWDKKAGLTDAYDRLVRDAGYVWQPPGLHERDLHTVLAPDLIMPVGPFEDEVRADAAIMDLERRAYSSQWEVPEDIHRAAMAEIRRDWAGANFTRTFTIEISFWRVDRFAELTKRPTQMS